jgi:hypothetical protein
VFLKLGDPHDAFFEALHIAFDEHRGFQIRPDDLWLKVTMGLAQCISMEPERYRNILVVDTEVHSKIEIRIHRNDFVIGSQNNDWQSNFEQFSNSVKEFIGSELHSLLAPEFSTTDIVSRAAGAIAIMDIFKEYFVYVDQTDCGIPEITLLGSVDDWRSLLHKIQAIKSKFDGLDWWLDEVISIANHFLSAATYLHQSNKSPEAERQAIDLDFWKSIYKLDENSGGDILNGHLLKLIPWIPCATDHKTLQKNPLVTGEPTPGEDGWHGLVGIFSWQIPIGLSKVPVVWQYLDSQFNYQFIAGHTAVGHVPETDRVYPIIGWGVKPKSQNTN